MSFIKRRKFLLASIASLTSLLAYSIHRGLRYPPVSWSPRPLSNNYSSNAFNAELTSLITLPSSTATLANFRAYTPEPQLLVTPKETGVLRIGFENLSSKAKPQIDGQAQLIQDQSSKTTSRELSVTVEKGKQFTISWLLPEQQQYQFAAIGDSGGGVELAWCMQRAVQLGADFLLHLGDFNYTEGEYDNAVKLFHNAPLPVYITIGNHDFHENGLIYQQFREQLGPMNNHFVINNVRFINLDTAANFFPVESGLRGKFVDSLLTDQTVYADNVIFTHRPIHDPRPGSDHTVSSYGEVAWILNLMQKLKANTLVTAHVHYSLVSDFEGIKQYIAGEGLGEEDTVNLKHIAKILVGSIGQNEKVEYRWEPLAMPMELHCSPRHISRLYEESGEKDIKWYTDTVPETCRADHLGFSLELLDS